MRDVVIVSGVRTPIGRGNKGSFKDTRPEDLLGLAIREAVNRAKPLEDSEVEDVIVGCSNPHHEQGLNVGRIGVYMAGLPIETAGATINRQCASGLQAIAYAAAGIACGFNEVVVAAGVESMTRVPMRSSMSEHPRLKEEFPDAYITMGLTAENVAERYKVKRSDMDAFSLESHRKALAAWERGKFKEHVIPVKTQVFETCEDGTEKAKDVTVKRDECPRANTSLEVLSSLKPVFKQGGVVTAGNSSPISDGAAAVVVMSREKAESLGLKPQVIIKHASWVGVHPAYMGIGPIYAVRKLLRNTGMSLDDIDLIELNEAFASQALVCIRELGIDAEKLNVNGGAIAIGHPLGATGVRIMVDLISEMKRCSVQFGLETMCVGGGMGAAMLVENAG